MSSLLTTKTRAYLELAKVELVFTNTGYQVVCICRALVGGSTTGVKVTIPIEVNEDLKLHVDMFTAAIIKKLGEEQDGTK